MLFHGVLITNLSGKIGGSIWSHNRGGPYVRANTAPTGGPSAEQTDMRSAMSLTVAAWHGLTSAQRELWRQFSAATPRVNRIGDHRPIGALPEFCRANVVRVYAGLWIGAGPLDTVNTPPDDGHGSTPLSPFTVDPIDATDDTFRLRFNPDDLWHSQEHAGLLVFVSPARTPSINWFRGPWTLTQVISNVDDPGLEIDLRSTAASGDRYFIKCRASDEGGQLSTPMYLHVEVP